MRKTAIFLLLLMTSPAWAKPLNHDGACLPNEVMRGITICDPDTNTTSCINAKKIRLYESNGWVIGACEVKPECGDGVLDPNESCESCPSDCGIHTVACCQYPVGTTTVDDLCSNCPSTLGGTVMTGCLWNWYASGDGQTCVPVGL